jgi:2-iminobutanoate/2-iminopropanoate deaminase
MNRRALQPVDGTYAESHEVSNVTRFLFISGQVPADGDGSVPPDFRSQCRLAWHNVEARLSAAGMSFDNLVKATVFLSDRRYREEAREVRQEVLGTLAAPPAITVVITGIYDEAWLLEIEATAAA